MIFLITLFFIMAILGIIFYRNIFNPLTIFNGVWFCALFFYNLKLTLFQTPLSSKGIQMFALMFISFNILYVFVEMVCKVIKKEGKKSVQRQISYGKIRLLFNIWLTFIVLEIIYERGVPLLWLVTGNSKSYVDFGIPSLHGFVNSLAWVILMLAFTFYLDSSCKVKKKEMKIIMLIIFTTYIALIARQFILTGLIQIFLIYVLKRKINLWKLLLWPTLVVFFFGIIGNMRTGASNFRVSAKITANIPDAFLGIYWVYMYMATPIGNIDSLVNKTFDLANGIFTAKSIIPSVFVTLIFKGIDIPSIKFFVTDTFNISTFLEIPYKDFGIAGVVITASIYGFISAYSWRKYKRDVNNTQALLICVICIQATAMSFFVNMLIMLPIIVQIVYIIIIFRIKLRRTKLNYQ